MEEPVFSYKNAIKEIEEILVEIENNDPDLDKLSEKIKRANFLIKECKNRLRKTSEEIDAIFEEWEN